jgi:hypothetical protein
LIERWVVSSLGTVLDGIRRIFRSRFVMVFGLFRSLKLLKDPGCSASRSNESSRRTRIKTAAMKAVRLGKMANPLPCFGVERFYRLLAALFVSGSFCLAGVTATGTDRHQI